LIHLIFVPLTYLKPIPYGKFAINGGGSISGRYGKVFFLSGAYLVPMFLYRKFEQDSTADVDLGITIWVFIALYKGIFYPLVL